MVKTNMVKTNYDVFKKQLYHIYKKVIKYKELNFLCRLIECDFYDFYLCNKRLELYHSRYTSATYYNVIFWGKKYFHETIDISTYYDVLIEIINKFGVKLLLDVIQYAKKHREWYAIEKDGLYNCDNKLIMSFDKNG